MALLSPDQSPAISDTIRFDLLTPNPGGCPPVGSGANNTYKIDRVTVYFVERDFTTPGTQTYQVSHGDAASEAAALAAEAAACAAPTADNVAAAARLRSVATSAATTTPFYYKNARAVKVFGSPDFPAWLRTDPDNSLARPFVDGTQVPGRFTLDWSPDGEAREGDFFVCWTWTPLPGGSQLSSHLPFSLQGDTQVTTSIPTHFTTPGKYVDLLDRYLPEMFKMAVSRDDLTADVLDKFHAAVARGFTNIEDLANQLIDLLDANSTHESLLPFLSNLFNLNLRGGDPTMWRRQIKMAVPLFKRKGTLGGLTEALAQAGVTLSKFTPLWQVASPYTRTDMFHVKDPSQPLALRGAVASTAPPNFSVSYRARGQAAYTPLAASYVVPTTTDGVTTLAWAGDSQTPRVALREGDLVVVLYPFAAVPAGGQSQENYLRGLELADERDPLDAAGGLVVPLKNWDVRVIDEDDVMFDALVPTRSPYADPVVFGKVRTEFPYSENIYNMEEYNGSTRDSTSPCDIDRDFLDVCSACPGGGFVLDVETQHLSDDRIKECYDIVREFVPFHARIHRANVSAGVNEFATPPVEDVETIVLMRREEGMIAGNANAFFTRHRLDGYDPSSVRRDVLATTQTVVSSATGVAFNPAVTLYCPDVRFDQFPVNATSVLEVFSPSPAAGSYSVSNPDRNVLDVAGVAEPVNPSPFAFRLSDVAYANPAASVSQDDVFAVSDAALDYGGLGVKGAWDVLHQAGYSGGAWSFDVPAYGTFPVADVAPDGSAILADPSRLLPTAGASGLAYTVLNDHSSPVATGTGTLTVTRRGRVSAPDANVTDLRDLVQAGHYLKYSGSQYQVVGFVPGATDQCYVDGYAGGDAAGVAVSFYRRFVDMGTGFLGYRGLVLDALYDIEKGLGIVNGSNPPDLVLEDDHFKESFAVLIGTDYYQVADVDANRMTLVGPYVRHGSESVGGEAVLFSVIRFVKDSITVDGQDFPFIDRRGNDMVEILVEAPVTALGVSLLNRRGGFEDLASHSEGASFSFRFKDQKDDR